MQQRVANKIYLLLGRRVAIFSEDRQECFGKTSMRFFDLVQDNDLTSPTNILPFHDVMGKTGHMINGVVKTQWLMWLSVQLFQQWASGNYQANRLKYPNIRWCETWNRFRPAINFDRCGKCLHQPICLANQNTIKQTASNNEIRQRWWTTCKKALSHLKVIHFFNDHISFHHLGALFVQLTVQLS